MVEVRLCAWARMDVKSNKDCRKSGLAGKSDGGGGALKGKMKEE